MTINKQIKTIFIVSAVFVAVFLVIPAVAYAQTESFFVSSEFDKFNRDNLQATLRIEGQFGLFYVEDLYFNSLSANNRARFLSDLQDVSNHFDNTIYPRVTNIFGMPRVPGIDGSLKVYILLTQTKSGIGGYFISQNSQTKSAFPKSNEKEMIYLNAVLTGNIQFLEFLAHEFQHLTNYNQKNILKNIGEDTWVNEMLSEVAPSVARVHDIRFQGSSLQNRIKVFLENPGTSLVLWQNTHSDYAIVSIFGHYLRDQFGDRILTEIVQADARGIDAVNIALSRIDAGRNFEEVFRDWTIAVLVNDCALGSRYCFTNPFLSGNNLRIVFGTATESEGDTISGSLSLNTWQARWLQFSPSSPPNTDKPLFFFDATTSFGATTTIPYIVLVDGVYQVRFAQLENGQLNIEVDGFGVNANQVTIIPINRNNANLSMSYTVGIKEGTSMATDDFSWTRDGVLVREDGDTRVYIIKNIGGNIYKRWITRAEIMDMYGHLRWEDIIVVSPETLTQFKTSDVIRFAGDPRVYRVVTPTTKTWIQSEAEFLSAGYTFDMVYEVNEREFNFYQ